MNAAGDGGPIGLLAPMPSEMQPLAKVLGLERDESARVYRGTVGATALVAARTGIGTERAAAATRRLLDDHGARHVVVVGIAGGMGASRVGDVLVPATVVLAPDGTEFAPSPLGDATPVGKLLTHDDFAMTDGRRDELVRDGFVAVDMETAAVAAVCAERAVPWVAVRAISDLVGVTPGDVISLANADGSPNVGASVRYLVTKPWRIPKLVRLARDSTRAARAAAEHAARILRAV